MVYSGPTWFVSLPATEHCCFINYNSYTGENHSAHSTFFDLTYVRPHKEMGGNLANWSVFGRWPTVIITPAYLIKQQQISLRNWFVVLLLYLFFENFSSKASGLLFIFTHISTGHLHFSNNNICISCEPDRPTSVFFSWRTPEKPTMKARLDNCGESPHPAFWLGKEPKLSDCRPLSVYTGFIYHLRSCSHGSVCSDKQR